MEGRVGSFRRPGEAGTNPERLETPNPVAPPELPWLYKAWTAVASLNRHTGAGGGTGVFGQGGKAIQEDPPPGHYDWPRYEPDDPTVLGQMFGIQLEED